MKDFFDKIIRIPLKKSKDIVEEENPGETEYEDFIEELRCKEIALYIAISYITNTISKCPFKVYENGKEVKNDLYYTLNVKANPNETASRLKYKIIDKMFYKGESLVFLYDNNLYCADSFITEHKPLKGDIFQNITLDNETGIIYDRKREDVYYFNLENDKQFSKVKNLIDSMYSGFQNLLKYAVSSYEGSNIEKYILDVPQVQAGEPEFMKKYRENLQEQLKKFLKNPKGVYPQFKGYKLDKLVNAQQKSDSEDIRNIKKEVFETVAETFRMPISMLYGNMTNVKEIMSQYLTFAIDPLATMISQELTSNSFTINEWKQGCYIKVDTTAINHQDIFEIADKIDKTISSGIFCIDEIRVKIGESPLNTEWSKKHYITKNYAVADEFLNNIEKGGDG